MKIKGYKNKDNNYIMPDEGQFLNGLRKVNIFVGANNSGKSRFMRQIFKGTTEDFVFFENINNELKKIYTELKPKFNDLFYMSDLKSLVNSETGNYASRLNEFIKKIEEKNVRSSGNGGIWDTDVALAIKSEMLEKRIMKKMEEKFDSKPKHIYIPILRGLRQLGTDPLKPDLYVIKTVGDYKLSTGGTTNDEVFSGLTIYSESKRMLLGSKNGRQFMRDFEKFISESFFSNKSITIVPDHDTDNLKLNINDGEEDREIFNLGDGVQSILICTFKLYQNQNQEITLFIEEPEMTIHPAMQRILIEAMINKFPKLQVFLTTHSNHFLDLTYDYPTDVAIFSFEEIRKEKFKIKNISDNVKILDLLGIRNSSVFLANCVIWTEGVTDRMILRRILKLKTDFKYTEDRHYSFAEYGGSNLRNFNFINTENSDSVSVNSLSRKNYIIADNDNKNSGEIFNRRQNLKKTLGENSVFDNHIEIENLIPYKIWNLVINKILVDHPNKDIQRKVISNKTETAFNNGLSSEKIGLLLKKIIEKKGNADPKYFENKDVQFLGETKKTIAEYIISAIDESNISLDEFPQTTQVLVSKMHEFVTKANNE